MSFDEYDADMPPDSAEWLALDEGERVDRVIAYHARERIRLPNARLHAAIHVVVENQLAQGERPVRETLERLQRQALSRHDAVHAIGSAVTELLLELSGARTADANKTQRVYEQRLAGLTASAYLGQEE